MLTELLPKGAGTPRCAPHPSSSLSALNPSLCSPAPFPPIALQKKSLLPVSPWGIQAYG